MQTNLSQIHEEMLYCIEYSGHRRNSRGPQPRSQDGFQLSSPVCQYSVMNTHQRYTLVVCMRMYMYVHVCMYVCMYVCTCKYACMYVCMYVSMYVCTCMYVCMYVSMYVHVSTHVCMCVYVCKVCMYYVHMYAHTVCVFVQYAHT